MSQEAFLNDEVTQSAVLYQLMIIGEAVKRLPTDFRKAHPRIPWSKIAAMRDKLIHAYDIVDIEEVWNTASRDVPALLSYVESLLSQERESN